MNQNSDSLTHEPETSERRAANRAATNRENAQHSTGPRTPEGKRRSSLNALRHGLTSHVIVLPSEDHTAYEAHSLRYRNHYKPQGPAEEDLVQIIIETTWRLHRVGALETNLLTLGMIEHEGTIHTTEPEANAALAIAAGFRKNQRAHANLGMHEQRLSKQLDRALALLNVEQAKRRANEADQLKRAAALLELHKEEGLEYNPADDGFVFSTPEIAAHITRRDREQRALSAAFSRR